MAGEQSLPVPTRRFATTDEHGRDVSEHLLEYRAGSSGLGHVGIPDNAQPHWYCSCGRWRKNRDLQGRPFRETAEKHHRKHVKDEISAPGESAR